MILINLLEWKTSFPEFSKWCKDNSIPVLRVSLTKYRLKEADFVFFKMKFDRTDIPRSRDED
jgi:hypothetical protein